MQTHNVGLTCDFRCSKNLEKCQLPQITQFPSRKLPSSWKNSQSQRLFWYNRNFLEIFTQSCLLDRQKVGRFGEFEAYGMTHTVCGIPKNVQHFAQDCSQTLFVHQGRDLDSLVVKKSYYMTHIKLKNFVLVSYLKISIWLPVTVSPIHVKIF